MWIKTKGGYLLNTDRIDYFICENGNTYGVRGNQRFLVSNKDITDNIREYIRNNLRFMEVRV